MAKVLEKYLLEVQGRAKEELPLDNPYRELGFDGNKKRLGWARVLPFSKIEEALKQVLPIIKNKKNFIFVGMGGSINGIKVLSSFFKSHTLYTLDSLDPKATQELLEKIKEFDKTLVIPISKSGTTTETQAIAAMLKDIFREKWQEHFLWLTDPDSFEKLTAQGWGACRKMAIQADGETDIGGRFSSPHTLIFFLPLFLLLNKDFKKVEEIYYSFLSLQERIRAQAYRLAHTYKDKEHAYFAVIVRKTIVENFLTWGIQFIQESLGSKSQGLATKAIVSSRKVGDVFLPLQFELKIDNPITYLMCEMYFLQVFVAFYSAFKNINFVNQDRVDAYKEQMRQLKDTTLSDAPRLTLEGITEEVRKRIAEQQFIEVVLYYHCSLEMIEKVHRTFTEIFRDRQIYVFVGSDWNHHSYQAAFLDKNTFYVLLLNVSYVLDIPYVAGVKLKHNVDTLKKIAQATYLTIRDKAFLSYLTE